MLLRDGVTDDELKRATNALLASFQAASDGAQTRRNESLADGIVSSAQGMNSTPAPRRIWH